MNEVKHKGFGGMPAFKSNAVGLSAASPHSLVPRSLAGFPLLSLTRNAAAVKLLVALAGCSNNAVMDNISRTEDSEKTEITCKPADATFSSQQLRIIPADPMFTPSPEVQERALGQLASRFRKHEITSTRYKEVQFIDPGQNFETVTCSQCGQQIEIDAWQELMGRAHESQFADLSIVTPCCNKPSSLNDLEYQSASGFARYVLTIIDPSENAGEESLPELESILGTKLKLIYAHV